MQYIYQHDDIFPMFFSYSAAEMSNEFIKRINGETNIKFIHWSSHDVNILACLGFLGYSDGIWPPYGSYIAIEFFRSRKTKEYFIVFRFNGKIINVPRFGGKDKIPFNDFTSFVRNHMPSLSEECEFNMTKFILQDTFFTPN